MVLHTKVVWYGVCHVTPLCEGHLMETFPPGFTPTPHQDSLPLGPNPVRGHRKLYSHPTPSPRVVPPTKSTSSGEFSCGGLGRHSGLLRRGLDDDPDALDAWW